MRDDSRTNIPIRQAMRARRGFVSFGYTQQAPTMSPQDAPLTLSVPAREQGMNRSRRDLASRAIHLAILLACVSACSSGNGTALPSPSTSPSASPSPSPSSIDPQAAGRAAVEAAYRSYWRVAIEAGRTANWQAPALTQWTTGAALRTVQRRYYAFSQNGQTLRGEIKLNPAVVSVTAAKATVRDCQDSSGLLVYDRNGRPMGSGTPRLDLAIATLVKEGDQWKVSDLKVTAGGC